MAYASKAGRARTSSTNPQAHAICDRCGARYNHVDLQWQFDWAGASAINKRILVCSHCLDTAQEQLRAIALPSDPVPIENPRVQDFVSASTTFRTVTGSVVDPITGVVTPTGAQRATQDDQNRFPQQTGFANGSLNNTPGTDPSGTFTTIGLPYLNITIPNAGDI